MKTCTALLFAGFVLTGCQVAAPKRFVPPKDDLADTRTTSRELVATFAKSNEKFLTNHSEKELLDAATNAATSDLKDPNSAQFRDVRIVQTPAGRVVCGSINAKNTYGGYVGFTPFAAAWASATKFKNGTDFPSLYAAANVGIVEACGSR